MLASIAYHVKASHFCSAVSQSSLLLREVLAESTGMSGTLLLMDGHCLVVVMSLRSQLWGTHASEQTFEQDAFLKTSALLTCGTLLKLQIVSTDLLYIRVIQKVIQIV